MIRALLKKRIVSGYLTSVLLTSLILQIIINIAQSDSPDDFKTDPIKLFLATSILLVIYTIIPSAFFILLCEKRSIQNIICYLLFACTLSLPPLLLLAMGLNTETLATSLNFSPAAIVSGVVYWFISGRHAGDDAKSLREQIKAFD
jgi:hypothetical protein